LRLVSWGRGRGEGREDAAAHLEEKNSGRLGALKEPAKFWGEDWGRQG